MRIRVFGFMSPGKLVLRKYRQELIKAYTECLKLKKKVKRLKKKLKELKSK